MHESLSAIATAVIALAPLASSLSAQEVARVEAPFQRLEDTGPRGYTLLSFSERAHEAFAVAHRSRATTELANLALPGGATVDLKLVPVSVWEEGGRAIVMGADGSVTEMAPSVKVFNAHVAGRASTGFIGISPEMMHGYLELEGERFVISTGPVAGSPLAVSHADALPTLGDGSFCNVLSDATGQVEPEEPDQSRAAGPKLRATKVYLECDKRFRDRFSSTQATIDYATLLVAATSEIYRRDLGTIVNLPNNYLRVWESTPPWGNTSTFGDLSKFMSWWKSSANSQNSVARAQVHLLSYPVFGGVANGVGVTCSQLSSFAISSCYGSFPYPIQHTSGSNWDLVVFAHETGHLYGSQHTFSYTPPIQCNDGSGPDKGTIMSYCHQSFGIGQLGLRFHRRVQDVMRMDLASKPCAVVTNLKRGDYTAEGVIDQADLTMFDAVTLQGFVSRGAQEVFDMDADGDMDAADRVILSGKVTFAKASSTTFNGSGANCPWCYTPITQPIIGQTWSTYVGGFGGAPVLTTIVGASAKLAVPLNLKFGELLVAMTGLGGVTLFQSNAMTNGQFAEHHNPIPFDPSFLGRTVETQAALFLSTGVELTNGMTLYVSSY